MLDWFVIYRYNSHEQKWPVTVALRQYNVAREDAELSIAAYKKTNNLYAGSIIARKT
jgi:hypothetical protein